MKQAIAGLGLMALLTTSLMAQDRLYAGQGTLDPEAPDPDLALIEALDEVLIRLTGQVDGQVRQVLGLGLGEARALVQSQQRVQVPVIDEAGERDLALRLQVQFTPAELDRKLAAAGLPRFGRERPDLLLWIALDDDDGIRLASDDELDTRVAEQARRLGLEVLRPLGDVLDLAEVTVNDVRGGFLDAGQQSLPRYQASVPVMLDLRKVGEESWNARWFWRIEGRDRSINLRDASPSFLIAGGMEALLASLASRYAVIPDDLGNRLQRLVVAPIDDSVQYAEVLGYLQGLSMVDSVRVLRAVDRAIDFELTLRSGGLVDAISLGGLLNIQQTLPDGRLALTFAQ